MLNRAAKYFVWGVIFVLVAGLTAAPVTVTKPVDGYELPDDPALTDWSRMERDWWGEVKVNWLSYTSLVVGGSLMVASVVSALVSCRRDR